MGENCIRNGQKSSLEKARQVVAVACFRQLCMGAKRKMLFEGLAPMAARGWTWPVHQAGMHLLVRHKKSGHVRSIASASSLDLALLSKYRAARAADDGLFLRFGALPPESLKAGVDELVAVATKG